MLEYCDEGDLMEYLKQKKYLTENLIQLGKIFAKRIKKRKKSILKTTRK